MDRVIPLDTNWLREHPLPSPDPHADKNARGRVFIVGGCKRVPGGLLLTAEAALRAGAGKVQVAVPASTALAIGVAMPEIAVFGAEESDEGEIAALDAGCDDKTLVFDAAALITLRDRRARVSGRAAPAILTPHIGEMAALLDCDAAEIDADRTGCVRRAAQAYGAVVTLKGSTTLIADRSGTVFAYAGGGVGLATGGSGDVLAGIAAGFASRGGDPLTATLWAVWVHGEPAAHGGDLAHLLADLGMVGRTFSPDRLGVDADQHAGTALRDLIIPHHAERRVPSLAWRRQTFTSRSFRMALSSTVSASSRLSLLFSSSN